VLENFDEVMSVAEGKKIVVFLDYDGTLSPIVDDPDKAYMSDAVSGFALLRTINTTRNTCGGFMSPNKFCSFLVFLCCFHFLKTEFSMPYGLQ